MTPRVLGLLVRDYSELTKNVIIGMGFQNIKEIEGITDKKTNLIYAPDAEEMKRIMLESDAAISAGGQTLYELARVGIPTIAVAVADNQMNNIKGWQRAGFIEYAGWWEEVDLIYKVQKAMLKLKGRQTREQMSQTGKRLVDGQGARRVADKIIEHRNENIIFRRQYVKRYFRLA